MLLRLSDGRDARLTCPVRLPPFDGLYIRRRVDRLNLDTSSLEVEVARKRRLVWKAAMIPEAEIAASLYVAANEIEGWTESIGTDA
jgi:hypothetical protein